MPMMIIQTTARFAFLAGMSEETGGKIVILGGQILEKMVWHGGLACIPANAASKRKKEISEHLQAFSASEKY